MNFVRLKTYLTNSNKENKSCKKGESQVEYLLGILLRGCNAKKYRVPFAKAQKRNRTSNHKTALSWILPLNYLCTLK